MVPPAFEVAPVMVASSLGMRCWAVLIPGLFGDTTRASVVMKTAPRTRRCSEIRLREVLLLTHRAPPPQSTQLHTNHT